MADYFLENFLFKNSDYLMLLLFPYKYFIRIFIKMLDL